MWRDENRKPRGSETFEDSSDPQLVEKVTDVVSRYSDPPERALVLSVDEKTRASARSHPTDAAAAAWPAGAADAR